MLFRSLSLLSSASFALCSCGVPPNDVGSGSGVGSSSGGTQSTGVGGGAGSGAGMGGVAVGAGGTAGSAGSLGLGGTAGSGAVAGVGGMGAAAGAGGVGTAGAGGLAGSGGVGTAGSAGTATDPCATAVVCDGFEGGMDPGWTPAPTSVPMPEIDATKGANGSTSSLKTVGTSSQSFITREVPGQSFYVRAYMNFEQSTETINGHGWYIVAADNISQGEGAQMRFGSSGNHGHKEIDFNVYNGGCTGERTQFSDGASDGAAGWENTPYPSVLLNADQWYCVEGYFNGTGHEFQLWIDGSEVPGLHVTEASMCEAWSPNYTHIKFGAGANSEIGAIWYDDVAVSTSRIGCK